MRLASNRRFWLMASTSSAQEAVMLVKVHALLWVESGLVVHEERRQGIPHLTLPGGRVLDRESVEEALRREVAEELGAEIRIGDLRYVVEVVHGHSVHDVSLVFGAEAITPLDSSVRIVDPGSGDGRVFPPILEAITADGRTGPTGTRWLGNVWRPTG
jgi:ADP-ribose pyrophosphatase YjhB (NUDIX family)